LAEAEDAAARMFLPRPAPPTGVEDCDGAAVLSRGPRDLDEGASTRSDPEVARSEEGGEGEEADAATTVPPRPFLPPGLDLGPPKDSCAVAAFFFSTVRARGENVRPRGLRRSAPIAASGARIVATAAAEVIIIAWRVRRPVTGDSGRALQGSVRFFSGPLKGKALFPKRDAAPRLQEFLRNPNENERRDEPFPGTRVACYILIGCSRMRGAQGPIKMGQGKECFSL